MNCYGLDSGEKSEILSLLEFYILLTVHRLTISCW